MTTMAEVIGVSRSNLMERMRARPKKRIGRPLPDGKLVAEIKAIIASCQPTATGVSTSSSSAKRWRLA